MKTILLLFIGVVIGAVGLYAYQNPDFRSQLSELVEEVLDASPDSPFPTPTPPAPAMAALPAPTATPMQTAPVQATPAPTETPLPTPTEIPESVPAVPATRVPVPSPIPASYSIEVVSVEEVADGQVDFMLEVRNESGLMMDEVAQVEMSVDGGAAELVNIIVNMPAGESASFAFARTLSPGPHAIRFSVGDSHTTVGVNVEAGDVTVSTFTSTPIVTATPTRTAIPTNTTVPTNTPTSTITPLPTNTAVPTHTPTPILTPETAISPDLRHLEEKTYMLELINAERTKAWLAPVILGDNIAAQLHAEAALENCFASHWGVDGLKPYMRYSLAGGYQSNSENAYGSDYCIKASERYSPIKDIQTEIRKAMKGWMSSGHRMNILDKWHKKINIGFAWDRYNFLAYQHFEGDYVEYDELPSIEEGILKIEGRTKNSARFERDLDLNILIFYDQSPHSLSRGQVSRTYCYDNGLLIAALREPLPQGLDWDEDNFVDLHKPCPDPYNVPADSLGPRSHGEAHRFWMTAIDASQATPELSTIVPWITALEWTASGEAFSVTTDLKDLLTEHGDGVYTIMVWGKVGSEGVVVSQYSIFHGVTPPDTYGQ